jgi:ATP-binding cassette subfamily F protein 3
VQATQLTKAFGAETVLDAVSFRLDPGEHLALVGRNGAGKTTLLRILAGQMPADAGQVSLPRGARVALHDQRPPLGLDLTLEAYVAQGVQGAEQAERDLAELEARMAGGDATPEVLGAYEAASTRLEQAGGYAWRAWMERVLRGLGISDEELGRPLQGFSGGELTRASLARALVSRPDVLLLDEPTNHLDLAAVEWLEKALADLGAAVLLVSHDRWFLESVATGILELDRGRGKLWPMRYSAFRRERALAAERAGVAADRQAAEIARLERFVTRWRAGTKSRQAASRQKRLDKMPRVEAPRRETALAFGFPRAERSARLVIEVDGLDVEVPGRRLVSGAGFAVERGQRVAVVGPNGTGKTTLIETLVGRRPPARGRVSLGHRVELAYFSQHGEDLPDDRTILETVLSRSDMTPGQARTLLGGFLFSGDMVDRKVEKLSGGERRRLGLVCLMARGGNLLVLDEPTNHLDTESREALEAALEAYDGTVVMVSHDRALIDAIATHTLALEEGVAALRIGGYTDLLRAREAGEAPAPARRGAPAAGRAAARTPATPRDPSPSRLQREVRRLEERIAEIEGRVASVEAELADPDVLADRERLAERGERHRELQEELAWVLREWERTAEAAS